MIALRKEHAALRGGELAWLHNSDESRVLSFLRRAAGEEIVVVINLSTQPFAGTVESPGGAAFADITPDTPEPQKPDAPATESAPRAHAASLPSVTIEAWGYRIFRRRR
jgi:glycosidase